MHDRLVFIKEKENLFRQMERTYKAYMKYRFFLFVVLTSLIQFNFKICTVHSS